MQSRTAKSCGPDAPTLASSLRSCVGPTGLRQNISAGDGGKRARSPGRARRKPLKPLRAGMPVDAGVLVVTRVRSITTSAHEAAGATGARHSPRPQGGREVHQRLGRIARRGRERVCKAIEDGIFPCKAFQRVVPANAGTHTARTLVSAPEQRPFFTFEARGDGSLRSQGRPAERLCEATTIG